MTLYAFLAVLNGMTIGLSRTVNGRLGVERGPLQAALWNHLVGFGFLTLALVATGGVTADAGDAPPAAYVGGFFGVLFVAVNSYVFPRVGAMNAALLVIGGQMIAAVLLDARAGHAASALRWVGVAVVLGGLFWGRKSR